MANPAFFEAAQQSAKSPKFRTLLTDLAKRARQHERLMAQFARQIGANRSRREGKPVQYSKAARERMRADEEQARELNAELPELVATLSDKELVQQALDAWETAALLHDPAVYHDDDRAFAERIRRHMRDAIRLIRKFASTHKIKLPQSALEGGLSFNVSFRRAVPDLGKLGTDCMAIGPALAALDRLAGKQGLAPLSRYVNYDPDGS